MYRCGKCNAPITVINSSPSSSSASGTSPFSVKVRLCAHTDAPIIAEASAHLEGRGGVR